MFDNQNKLQDNKYTTITWRGIRIARTSHKHFLVRIHRMNCGKPAWMCADYFLLLLPTFLAVFPACCDSGRFCTSLLYLSLCVPCIYIIMPSFLTVCFTSSSSCSFSSAKLIRLLFASVRMCDSRFDYDVCTMYHWTIIVWSGNDTAKRFNC